jgi:hypothetical protein
MGSMRRTLIVALAGGVLWGCSADAGPGAPPAPPPTDPPTYVVDAAPSEGTARSAVPEGPLIVAAVGRRFMLHQQPGAASARPYTSRNDFGQELWLPVVGRASADDEAWFRVLVPERPNGRDAWVRAGDVEVRTVDDRVVVDLSTHTLVHHRGDRVVRRVEVAIGAPGTPTVPGRFFVWARVGYQDTAGPYGNYALGLSGFSEVLTEWPGGGRMAIHGTADPADIGWNVSHGCVRVFNPQMARLIDVPMGATVVIRP